MMISARPQSTKKQRNGLHEPLTPRESEILELLCEGLSNKEIGAKLKVSPFTVKNHLARIFVKLRVRSRTAALMAYLKRSNKPK